MLNVLKVPIQNTSIDFEYLLDAPAGKYGFIKIDKGHFYLNKKRLRFFGVNLAFNGSIPEKEAALLIADRLAKSGINMVRLHHIDSYNRKFPGFADTFRSIIDYSDCNSQKINAENIDRLDFLFAELKKRGIYIHLDLFVRRAFLSCDDLDYSDRLDGRIKNINLYNHRLIDLQKKFIQQYLTHKNPYTGLEYREDPAIAVMQLVNENSIFWKSAELYTPSYANELNIKWNEWLLQKYKTRKKLNEAWANDGEQTLLDTENPEEGTVQLQELGVWGERMIDYSNAENTQRFYDNMEFLLELESNFVCEMKKFITELGVKCPINVSNLPMGVADLNCINLGDVIENNSYWNHPKYVDGNENNMLFHNQNMSSSNPMQESGKEFAENLITRLSSAKVEGKPFICTEWNACGPITLFL